MTGENATHGDWRSLWPLFVRGRFVGRDLRASRETLESGAYFDRQSVKRRETSSFYALAETRGGAAIVPKKKKKKLTDASDANAGSCSRIRCHGRPEQDERRNKDVWERGEREKSHTVQENCVVSKFGRLSRHIRLSRTPPQATANFRNWPGIRKGSRSGNRASQQ